jgi:hypothetical protein
MPRENQGNGDGDGDREEDLYDDLDETIKAPASKRAKLMPGQQQYNHQHGDLPNSNSYNGETDATASTNTKRSADSKNTSKGESIQSQLQQRIKQLEEENSTLKRNIGILFRTAKNEIKRKDDQIKSLLLEQQQQQQQQHQKAPPR